MKNRENIFIIIFILVFCLAVGVIYVRATAVNVDTEAEIEPTEPGPMVVIKTVYVPKEIVYTPINIPDEPIITPDVIAELPDFERCCAIMAQMLWGEIGAGSDDAVAAVAWCVCNRAADDERTPEAVIEQIVKKGQFYGYDENHPIDARLYKIGESVLIQWMMEPYTTVGINRILPEDYKWFGGDGRYNTFRNSFVGGEKITVK